MLEHCKDFRRVKKLTDANPMKGRGPWQLSISREIFYLVEVEDEKDIGAWAFVPHEEGYQMHAAMSDDCRGRKAVSSGLNAIAWLFANTEANSVYAGIPVELKHAHVIPRAAGLKFIGVKDGLRCYEMRRENFAKRAA